MGVVIVEGKWQFGGEFEAFHCNLSGLCGLVSIAKAVSDGLKLPLITEHVRWLQHAGLQAVSRILLKLSIPSC